jgi:hypothetical protein
MKDWSKSCKKKGSGQPGHANVCRERKTERCKEQQTLSHSHEAAILRNASAEKVRVVTKRMKRTVNVT